MKRRSILTLVTLITLMVSLFNVRPVGANPPYPEDPSSKTGQTAPDQSAQRQVSPGKTIDQPNALDVMKIRARQELIKQGNYAAAAQLDSLTAQDHVLVVLVEFAGTDEFTWTPGVSTWDPIGKADMAEDALAGDCSMVTGIPSVATDYTYGPTLHNALPRPLSAADASGNTIWTPDFTKSWYESFMFGNGVTFKYDRVDGSKVNEDFTGKSVVKYYQDMSGGKYTFGGDVIGWIQVPHSTWWYGADDCPGRRSQALMSAGSDGGIPGAGSAQTLVQDSLDKIEAMRAGGELTGFDWANYDTNGDHVIDRLWIVHAGYGEEDSSTLMNRTDYSEAAVWSHSGGLSPQYAIGTSGYKAGAYIMMPENGGIGVFAHEYGHNLGADDLYAYGNGETSAGFWTLMADDWTGYPLGFQPPAVDPWHLDEWGWLNPKVIDDPTQVYTVTVGQASSFPGGTGVERGVKIALPDGNAPLAVGPKTGGFNWWGGNSTLTNAMMTLKNPIAVPAGGGTFSFDLAYGIETEWDFLWVQASTDGGTTWKTLTNANTTCTHDSAWIGGLNGFPNDLCAANSGGFTDYNASFPAYDNESFALDDPTYGGKNVLLRFWYMTDWGTQYEGPFIDNIKVDSLAPAATLFSDGAEAANDNWTLVPTFQRTDGTVPYTHNLYLQWRNTSATGGYDSGLGDPRFRYGPTNSGLLVWYNNNYYTDNEVANYLTDYPSYGPKGRMLVVDANGDPYRYPDAISAGYNNEGGNLPSRSLMRDATFSLNPGVPFSYAGDDFAGRPAVSFFDDALGYYPGAEYVSRGPGYTLATAYKWITKQWDASSITPAADSYPFNALGYQPNDELRFNCAAAAGGRLGCYYYGTGVGLGYAGGTGNPGDYGVQYGWHVDILSQTDKTATLKIWNANWQNRFAADKGVLPNEQVSYAYHHVNQSTTDETFFACANLDVSKVTYVSGTNVLPLTARCGSAAPLALAGGSLNTTIDPSKVVAVAAFQQTVMAGDSVAFNFIVQPKVPGTSFIQMLDVFENGVHRVVEALDTQYHLFLPVAKR